MNKSHVKAVSSVIVGIAATLAMAGNVAASTSTDADLTVVCRVNPWIQVVVKSVTVPLIFSFAHPMAAFRDNFISGELTCDRLSPFDNNDPHYLDQIVGMTCLGAKQVHTEGDQTKVTFEKTAQGSIVAHLEDGEEGGVSGPCVQETINVEAPSP